MGYAKERGKLEKLLAEIDDINIYDEKSFAALVDRHEKYSHTIRILKNKEPEAFSDLYKNELQQIKDDKKSVKESESDEIRQKNFTTYKETIKWAVEKTIRITMESL